MTLARLLLAAGSVVSREDLADAVWDDEPPVSWLPALRNVIDAGP